MDPARDVRDSWHRSPVLVLVLFRFGASELRYAGVRTFDRRSRLSCRLRNACDESIAASSVGSSFLWQFHDRTAAAAGMRGGGEPVSVVVAQALTRSGQCYFYDGSIAHCVNTNNAASEQCCVTVYCNSVM